MKPKPELLPPEIKKFIEWELSHYLDNLRRLELYKERLIPSAVPSYSGESGSTDPESRPTERVALIIATDVHVMYLEQMTAGISFVIDRLTAEDRKLIELVYWTRSYSVEGAGLVLHMSKPTAYRHINAILLAIARERGYIPL